MNRFKRAWLALVDRLETEVRTVTMTQYLPEPKQWENFYKATWRTAPWESESEYFHSCAQALAEHPGAYVKVVLGFTLNGQVFIAPGELVPIEVQPKLKSPKGRARG